MPKPTTHHVRFTATVSVSQVIPVQSDLDPDELRDQIEKAMRRGECQIELTTNFEEDGEPIIEDFDLPDGDSIWRWLNGEDFDPHDNPVWEVDIAARPTS